MNGIELLRGQVTRNGERSNLDKFLGREREYLLKLRFANIVTCLPRQVC